MTVDEIAAALGKPTIAIPEPVLRAGLAVGKRLGVTAYGPEQTKFLQHRPVLDNTRLKEVFGYTPSYTSAEALRRLESGASLVGPGTMVHMRAIWKGAVSFGLVSVPVKLYSATESKDISFRQVHAKDGGRIKYQRVCSLDGEEVEYADIAKGYETEDGEMVILTDEDMAELPANSSREISVEKFVPSDQIDPMLFEKSYYLEPEKTGAKPYALLREALEAADRMALVTVSLRNRMSLAVLRVRDDVIVMQTMMWPDEIRKADFGSVDTTEAKPAEVKMAKMLVETLAGDFAADDYEDDYREAVEALVKAKVEGGEVKRTPEAKKSSGEVVDLLAALQRSVDAAKTARGEKSVRGRRLRPTPARSRTPRRPPRRLPPRSRRRRRPPRRPRRRLRPRRPADHRWLRSERSERLETTHDERRPVSAPVAARSSARSCRSSARPGSRSR